MTWTLRLSAMFLAIQLAGCASNFRQGLEHLENENHPEALAFFELDAKQGYRVPAILAAELYMLDYQIPRNLEQSEYYLNLGLKAEYGPYDQAWDYFIPLIKAYQILADTNRSDKSQAFEILNYEKYEDYHWALTILGHCHLVGYGVDKDTDKAKAYFEKSLDNEIFEGSSLLYAFWLSVYSSDEFANGIKALEITEQLKDDEDFNTKPIYLDTLASAYAANSEYEAAAATQEQALKKLYEQIALHPYLETFKYGFESRMESYTKKQPWKLSDADIERCGYDSRRCTPKG